MFDQYVQDYTTVAAIAFLGLLIVGGGIGLSKLVRPHYPTPAKNSPYECGVDPVGSGWSQTHIRYYIFALLFLIFDVEAVFIFPWAVQLETIGMFALVEMLVFIGILVAGLVYAIRKGVLKWE